MFTDKNEEILTILSFLFSHIYKNFNDRVVRILILISLEILIIILINNKIIKNLKM